MQIVFVNDNKKILGSPVFYRLCFLFTFDHSMYLIWCLLKISVVKSQKLFFLMTRFPADASRKKIWIDKICRKDWLPSSSSRICSDHYIESCFDRTRKITKLKDNAIPTRFKGFPTYMQKV